MKHNQTVPLLDAAADSVPLTDEEKADCGLLSELFPEDDSGVKASDGQTFPQHPPMGGKSTS